MLVAGRQVVTWPPHESTSAGDGGPGAGATPTDAHHRATPSSTDEAVHAGPVGPPRARVHDVIDVYRSASGRSAVTAWTERRLGAWPSPHASLDLAITASAETLEDAGARAVPREATEPVPTRVLVRAADGAAAAPTSGPPAVLLVPDAGWCAATCLDAADALSRLGTVWVVDVPGQPGLSSPLRPRRGQAVWTAAWLDALVAASGAEGLMLVGHAAGAIPVLGARHEGIGSRVLLAPGGIVPVRVGPRMARDAARWHMRATPATSRALGRHLVGREQGEPDADVVDWLTTVGRSCRSQPASRPLPRFVLDRALADPALVLVGEDDCYFTAAAMTAALAKRSDDDLDVTVAELPRTGHLPTPAGWRAVAERGAWLANGRADTDTPG